MSVRSAIPPEPGRGGRNATSLRRVHRWLGVGTLLFVILLSVTGIALNHTADLDLDERFVSSAWLLDWYGIDVPQPVASFASERGRVTLLGERLYLDAREIARGVTGLAGALAHGERIAVATPDALLLLTSAGGLAERAQVAGAAPIERLGLLWLSDEGTGASVAARIVVASGGQLLAYDQAYGELRPGALASGDVRWSAPSAVPDELHAQIARHYRGEGVSWARLMYDIHSGRVLSSAGTLTMDAVGVLLVLLSLTGLILWVKGRRRD